jgi:hypothetical protein
MLDKTKSMLANCKTFQIKTEALPEQDVPFLKKASTPSRAGFLLIQ